MKRGYADTPDGQIHYITEGVGDPILLLHSTPMSSDQFYQLIPVLAKKCWVVAMDTLGYGLSDKPSSPYSAEDYASNINSFLKELGIKKASIFGNFTGASLAIEFAVKYPEKVDKLVLSGVLLKPSPPYVSDIVPTEDGSFLLEAWKMFYEPPRPFVGEEAAYRMFISGLLAGTRQSYACHAATSADNSEKMPQIKSPTLLVSGEKDVFFENIEPAQKLIPRSKIKVIPGGGWSIAYSSPAEFAEVVLDFLENPGV